MGRVARGSMPTFWQQTRLVLWKNFILRKRQPIIVFLEIAWPLVLAIVLVLIRRRKPVEDKPEEYFFPFALPSAGWIPFAETLICQRGKVDGMLNTDDFGEPNYTASYAFRNVMQELAAAKDVNWTTLYNFPKVLGSMSNALAKPSFYNSMLNASHGLQGHARSNFRVFLQKVSGMTGVPAAAFSGVSVNWNKLFILALASSSGSQSGWNSLCHHLPTTTAQLACSLSVIPAAGGSLAFASSLLAGTPFLLTGRILDPAMLKVVFCSPFLFGQIFQLPQGTNKALVQKLLCRLNDKQRSAIVSKLIEESAANFWVPAGDIASVGDPGDFAEFSYGTLMVSRLVKHLKAVDTSPLIRFMHFLLTHKGPIDPLKAASAGLCHRFNNSATLSTLITKLFGFFENSSNITANEGADEDEEVKVPHSESKHHKKRKSDEDVDIGKTLGFVRRIVQIFKAGGVHVLFSPNNYLGYRIIKKALEPASELITVLKLSSGVFHDTALNLAQSLKQLKHAAKSPAAISFLNSPSCTSFTTRLSHGQVQFLCRVLTALGPTAGERGGKAKGMSLVAESVRILIKASKMSAFARKQLAGLRLSRKVKGLPSEDDVVARAVSLSQEKKFAFAGIVFENLPSNSTQLPRHVVYKIRQNSTLVPSTATIHRYAWQPGLCWSIPQCMSYQHLGFNFIQDMIDRAIIQLQTNTTTTSGYLPGGWLQSFPYPCFYKDRFAEAMSQTLPLFLVLGWVFGVAMLIKNLVYEKEERLREIMKVMGMSSLAHWMAWFISSLAMISLSSLLVTVCMKAGHVLDHIDTVAFFLFLELFGISTICFCFLISTLFSRANLAACCGSLVFFAAYLPYSALFIQKEAAGPVQKVLACLLSPTAFGMSTSYISFYEEQGVGLNWSNMAESPLYNDNFNFVVCCTFMAFDAIVYLLLALYLDQVLPGRYGVAVKWYAPFQVFSAFSLRTRFLSWWRVTHDGSVLLTNDSSATLDEIGVTHRVAPCQVGGSVPAEVSAELESEVEPTHLRCGVALHNLVKEYGTADGKKVAVDGLSLNFYEGQITAFLGHNGAGKTTTMSILSGIHPPTDGTAFVYGLDIRKDMATIRQSLGICPQFNVLFKKLTVEEHMFLYASLKGVAKKEIKRNMEKWLGEVDLVKKRDCLSENLSGGMQRKLSIAVAFVGGSQTVILDEPTAGVDPFARRCIWDMLIKYRNQGRTIILSTHFMDEADILGDRIAIVSHGKLRCVGTSFFLKCCFGSGYTITLVKKQCGPADTDNSVDSDNSTDKADSTDKDDSTDKVDSTDKADSTDEDDSTDKADSTNKDDLADKANPADNDNSADKDDSNDNGSKSDDGEVSVGCPAEMSKSERLSVLMDTLVPNTELMEDIGDEITFRLPHKAEQTEEFLHMLSYLGSHLDELGLVSFGVSDSTLEQVFLKVSAGKNWFQKSPSVHSLNFHPDMVGDEVGSLAMSLGRRMSERAFAGRLETAVAEFNEESLSESTTSISPSPRHQSTRRLRRGRMKHELHRNHGLSLFCQRFRALFLKRFHHTKRNRRSYISQGILPPLLIAIAMIIKLVQNFPVHEKPLLLQPSLYPGPNYMPFQAYQGASPLARSQVRTLDTDCGVGASHLWLSPQQRKDVCRRSGRWYMAKALENPKIVLPPKCELQQEAWERSLPRRLLERATVNKCTLQKISNKTNFGALIREKSVAYRWRRWGGLTTGLVFSGARRNQSGHRVVDELAVASAVKVWSNNNGYHSAPIYLNVMNNALLRAALPRNVDYTEYGISVITHPFNKTALELQGDYLKSGIDLLITVVVVFAMAFVPASFSVFLIEENTSGAKGLQRLSGVSGGLYWCASIVWDFASYLLICGMCLLIMVIFQADVYLSSGNFPAVVLLFLLYGFSSTPMMYPASYFFKIPSTAYVFLVSVNIFCGVFGNLTTFILQLFHDSAFQEVNDIMRVAFLCFPSYCLGRGLMDLSYQHYRKQLAVTYGLKYIHYSEPWGFGEDQIGRNVVAMMACGVFFFTLTLIIEYQLFQRLMTRLAKVITGNSLQAGHSTVEDEDVKKEANSVMSGRRCKGGVVLNGLTKVYWSPVKSHRSVNSLHLAVQKGQCFGLLGVNGAGKTTTFKMLTGGTQITGGDALLNGISVAHNRAQAHKQIGYCPQFDAIDDLLTVREHIHLYARLRGIPEKQCERVADWCISKLQLRLFADKLAGTLSGGNKRKLSTAIAIAGKPSLILLDEPTTGMDPHARRFLWTVITSLVRSGHCVVLTSHSMEECEALCQRLSIMVNGEFRCLGSPQHLKEKFGTGYTVTLRLKGRNPDLSSAKQFCMSTFPNATVIDEHHNMLQYQLSGSVQLHHIFSTFQKVQDELNIEAYSISQTTLDQVFISFARNQTSEDNEESDASSSQLSNSVSSDSFFLSPTPRQPSRLRVNSNESGTAEGSVWLSV